MGDVPFIAVGNDELGPPLGDTFHCPRCNAPHQVEYGTSKKLLPNGTWSAPVESRLLGFYKCNGELYLAGIDGMEVHP